MTEAEIASKAQSGKTSSFDDIKTELASRRTGMAFQRTRLSADRTLMAVIRTSLSLIGFGFTIFQFFRTLKDRGIVPGGSSEPRNFGVALVFLGVAMLIIGIIYHVRFMIGLRSQREAMVTSGLVAGESLFPPSMTLIAAGILLLIGVAAIASMIFNAGPFG